MGRLYNDAQAETLRFRKCNEQVFAAVLLSVEGPLPS
jgi:hypothetical protein